MSVTKVLKAFLIVLVACCSICQYVHIRLKRCTVSLGITHST